MAIELTITVSRFLEYYYEQGSDQEIKQLKLKLAEQVIESFYNVGQSCISVQDIFDGCDKGAIHVNYIEEFSNDIYDELSDFVSDFDLKLIPDKTVTSKPKRVIDMNIDVVFNPLIRELFVVYGGVTAIHSFEEADEWFGITHSNEEEFLDIHLHYDESLSLIFYFREFANKNKPIETNVKSYNALDSEGYENIDEGIVIVYNDQDFEEAKQNIIKKHNL